MSPLWPGLDGPAINYISRPPHETFAKKSPRNIVILGSTGSIGRNGLAVLEKTSVKILALAAGYNITLLVRQALRFRPPFLAVADQNGAENLKKSLPADYRPEILIGQSGFAQLAALESADCILSGQAGSAGLTGTLAAALAGKVIALANKESLVMAGELLRRLCRKTGAAILPVDSEHQALFQCLAGRGQEAAQLILTASGGPFLDWPAEKIRASAPEQALKHPTWQMGAKISIDSASLMNKGLEFIEAMHLYGVGPENIQILIHPQSIVHSLARFRDNSLLAQLAIPDMRLALSTCLLWPHADASFVAPLDLAETPPLQFQKPDLDRFPCLKLALRAASARPGPDWQEIGLNPACISLNAANEDAVARFLRHEFRFGEIARRIEAALANVQGMRAPEAPALAGLLPWQQALALSEIIERIAQRAIKNRAPKERD